MKVCFFEPGVFSLSSQPQVGFESFLTCCEPAHSLSPLCHLSLAFLWPCSLPECQWVQKPSRYAHLEPLPPSFRLWLQFPESWKPHSNGLKELPRPMLVGLSPLGGLFGWRNTSRTTAWPRGATCRLGVEQMCA